MSLYLYVPVDNYTYDEAAWRSMLSGGDLLFDLRCGVLYGELDPDFNVSQPWERTSLYRLTHIVAHSAAYRIDDIDWIATKELGVRISPIPYNQFSTEFFKAYQGNRDGFHFQPRIVPRGNDVRQLVTIDVYHKE